MGLRVLIAIACIAIIATAGLYLWRDHEHSMRQTAEADLAVKAARKVIIDNCNAANRDIARIAAGERNYTGRSIAELRAIAERCMVDLQRIRDDEVRELLQQLGK